MLTVKEITQKIKTSRVIHCVVRTNVKTIVSSRQNIFVVSKKDALNELRSNPEAFALNVHERNIVIYND